MRETRLLCEGLRTTEWPLWRRALSRSGLMICICGIRA